MQPVSVHLDLIAYINLFGIFLGLLISFFLIKKSWRRDAPNGYMGILILSLSLIMFEGWLNYTGYIFKVLSLTNFSEPLNFAIAPLIYLFMTTQLGDKRGRRDLLHFLPFLLWLGYCFFFFGLQDEFKFNDNVSVMQLEIPPITTTVPYTGDPLGLRNYINLFTIIHILVYMLILTYRLIRKTKELGHTIFNTTHKTLRSLRNTFYHFAVITVILILVKLNFEKDLGDYLIFLYMSFMIFLTAYQIMNSSSYYLEASSFLEGPVLKYKKSSLSENEKDRILQAIDHQMTHEKYFKSSNASLSGLAKTINQSQHHVSQVINEKLKLSFFELLASHRVEEAKEILRTELGKKLTIEEIAEQVGYNSKSAFNTAFKKFTSLTPSAFRDS
jgi:AraC-like DNA-binding protein